MSKAGQYNFTGISAQADITLVYLLQSCKRDDFQQIVIEGDSWEDFTLIFDEHNIDFEVKWHSRPVSYSLIKSIIDKELQKQLGEKFILKIVVKKISDEFKSDYEYIKDPFILGFSLEKSRIENDPIIKKFLQKNWSLESIAFLTRTEIIEFYNEKYVTDRILEYFALEEPFYLSPKNQQKIVAVSFREILMRGAKGERITRQQFLDTVEEFKKSIANQSESFDPELSIRNKIINLNQYLSSEQEFKKLDRSKYLSPISAKSRLIFYITNKLEQSEFDVRTMNFFISKILIKKHYINLTMRLFSKKWEQRKIDAEYLINFLTDNYKNLFYDFNYDQALKIIYEIASEDEGDKYKSQILSFLEKERLIQPISLKKSSRSERLRREEGEKEEVAKIMEIFYQRTIDKKRFIDFVFDYFDFTNDDYENVIVTHPKIYTIVRNYISQNINFNFDSIVKKISNQFDLIYGGRYNGYEWAGGGIFHSGSTYSISDIGVVRLLFKPLFNEFYIQFPEKAWQFFKKNILNRATKKPNKNNPIYLKRSLISIILDRVSDEILDLDQKEESFCYLLNILKMKKGIPGTSEMIFDELRRRDLSKIGLDKVMILIEIDSIKYKGNKFDGEYPSNVFVTIILIQLIKLNYQPGKKLLLNILKKPDLFKKEQRYDLFELLSINDIPENDPDYIMNIFKTINLGIYLKGMNREKVWYKSGILSGLILSDWKDNLNRGQEIVDSLFAEEIPGEAVLEFIGNCISDLLKKDPLKTYNMIKSYLQDKISFKKKFSANPHARTNIVWLADELAKNKYYEESRQIIELCIDDPDPQTNCGEDICNYHLKIKNGEHQNIITTVRGTVAWVLHKIASSNEPLVMKYALEKTELLLDLDGSLAKKLGYDEPDYYVRHQALFPLVELAHPWRRKTLNEFESGMGDKIKTLAFKLIEIVEDDFKNLNIKPIAILENLVPVFKYIKDLDTYEAKRILEFFEKYKITDSYPLFIYFAIYRGDQYKDISFDSEYFINKLKILCNTRNEFKPKIAWEFFKIVEDKNIDNKIHFDKIENYWKLLFDEYQKDVFEDLYNTLEITLTWPEKYDSHKELLKKAIQKETQYTKNLNQSITLWGIDSDIFKILKDHDQDDFLDVFCFLLESINENIQYFRMREWIIIFKSLTPKPDDKIEIYKKIKSRLSELLPEEFEESNTHISEYVSV